MFATILLCILQSNHLRMVVRFFLDTLEPFSKLSNISYGLYIVHYPVLVLWKSSNILEFLIHAMICIGLSYFVESKSINPIYYLMKKSKDPT